MATKRAQRTSSPAARAKEENDSDKMTPSKPQAATSLVAKSSGVECLPPQICGLALGIHGVAVLLMNFGRVFAMGAAVAPLSLMYSSISLALLGGYLVKVLLAPRAFWRDACHPGTLANLGAGNAAVQALVARFHSHYPLVVAQGILVTSYGLGIVIVLRFLLLNYREGLYPEPSWFPGMFLIGMIHIPSQVIGPAWLMPHLPVQLMLLNIVYIPIKIAVVYRLFFSPVRASVAPNAGMNILMAPASFFAMVHLACQHPHGELVSAMFFASSTVFLVVTLCMLYTRRGLWTKSFHPSYAAFTFPVTSTATAAVLAAERLPHVKGFLNPAARMWAMGLTGVTVLVVSAVFLRFMIFAYRQVRPGVVVVIDRKNN